MNKADKKGAQYDVIILGAGASGLMCAIAAGQRGRRVLVLERANKIAKKILMSGGGRCNFTNYEINAENYISRNPHFCKSALTRYTQWDFVSLVDKHSIEYEQRDHNQLFCKHSAKDIVAMLLDECQQVGVEIQTDSDVIGVISQETDTKSDQRYQLGIKQAQQTASFSCQSLVVATGGLSIPSLGGSGFAYQLAKQFNLELIERRAGLVPFMFSDGLKAVCERLSGLALAVEVSCQRQQFTENMLFTHRGISGPAILQISNYWQQGDEIRLNLLPYLDAGQWLIQAKKEQSKSLLKTALHHKLAKNLVAELQTLWWDDKADKILAEWSDKALLSVGDKINNWRLKPSATEGYRTAEVTLGGVNTDAISSKTMEVKQQAGLYFIGEALDVTGHLGGYNFQWAWSSGHCAGLVA